ncbi:RDD family protein [Streptomyces sp. NPDC048290]|uniref:RDD family protein n=1 Tax=Streptomyces sp. NPDC048290 TaxID=3155811 RepID=UPI003430C5D9
MSAPTPAPGDDRPREGYYPDPSIPGYVRYWNGAAWVPGTSRPAPADGEPLSPPPGVRPATPVPPVEETGPHFFDEDPDPAPAPGEQYGSRPEPATAWGADRARQSGFGADQDRRVSWGSPDPAAPQGNAPHVGASPAGAPYTGAPQPNAPRAGAPQPNTPSAADPRLPRAAEPSATPPQPDGRSARTHGTASIPPADDADGGATEVPGSGSTFVFRRPTATQTPDEGTMTFRPQSPQGPTAPPGPTAPSAPQTHRQGPGFGAGRAAADRANTAQPQPQSQPHLQPRPPAQAAPVAPAIPTPPTTPTVPPQATPSPIPSVPAQHPGTPLTTGSGGGQSSWAQQVHRLAGASGADGAAARGGTPGSGDEPVTPWRPPVDDPFQAMARRQSAARPAALGKRLAARLVDTLAVAAVTAVAAVPLGAKALDHIDGKIEAARLSGQTVTVWLLDGTTSVYLGILVGVLLLFGVLYEALPTAKWGRTLGKRLLGLEVRDIEAHEPPTFGAALRRWLVYSVPGLLCFGLIGVLWCLFDKPWRQCWHDKAAGTFVAG